MSLRPGATCRRTARPSDEDLLAVSLSELQKGNLAYSTPEKMKSGQTERVVAKIGGEKVAVHVLQSDLPKENGKVSAVAETPVSPRMKMTLKSADFDITPLSSEEQIVAGETPTTWEWDIVPKHSGKLRLHLAAIVEIKQLSRDFATIDREIAVRVDPVEAAEKFIQTNCQWVIATLTAAAGAGWKLMKDRKRNLEPPSPPIAGAASL